MKKYIKPELEVVQVKEITQLMGNSQTKGSVVVDPWDTIDPSQGQAKGNNWGSYGGVRNFNAWED